MMVSETMSPEQIKTVRSTCGGWVYYREYVDEIYVIPSCIPSVLVFLQGNDQRTVDQRLQMQQASVRHPSHHTDVAQNENSARAPSVKLADDSSSQPTVARPTPATTLRESSTVTLPVIISSPDEPMRGAYSNQQSLTPSIPAVPAKPQVDVTVGGDDATLPSQHHEDLSRAYLLSLMRNDMPANVKAFMALRQTLTTPASFAHIVASAALLKSDADFSGAYNRVVSGVQGRPAGIREYFVDNAAVANRVIDSIRMSSYVVADYGIQLKTPYDDVFGFRDGDRFRCTLRHALEGYFVVGASSPVSHDQALTLAWHLVMLTWLVYGRSSWWCDGDLAGT